MIGPAVSQTFICTGIPAHASLCSRYGLAVDFRVMAVLLRCAREIELRNSSTARDLPEQLNLPEAGPRAEFREIAAGNVGHSHVLRLIVLLKIALLQFCSSIIEMHRKRLETQGGYSCGQSGGF